MSIHPLARHWLYASGGASLFNVSLRTIVVQIYRYNHERCHEPIHRKLTLISGMHSFNIFSLFGKQNDSTSTNSYEADIGDVSCAYHHTRWRHAQILKF